MYFCPVRKIRSYSTSVLLPPMSSYSMPYSNCKVLLFTLKCIQGTSPQYLCDFIKLYKAITNHLGKVPLPTRKASQIFFSGVCNFQYVNNYTICTSLYAGNTFKFNKCPVCVMWITFIWPILSDNPIMTLTMVNSQDSL